MTQKRSEQEKSYRIKLNIAFSHDVTAAILLFQKKEAAAMLVFQTNPVGVELFSYINAFFFPINWRRCSPLSENALWEKEHWSKEKLTDHFKLQWFQQNKMRMTQIPRLFLQNQLALIKIWKTFADARKRDGN